MKSPKGITRSTAAARLMQPNTTPFYSYASSSAPISRIQEELVFPASKNRKRKALETIHRQTTTALGRANISSFISSSGITVEHPLETGRNSMVSSVSTTPQQETEEHSSQHRRVSVESSTPQSLSTLTTEQSESVVKKEEKNKVDEEEKVEVPFWMVHPPSLWDDEAGIFHRFGMGGRVSPMRVPGFAGYFRQHWKDFHVTEMCMDSTAPCGGKCLPRHYDFSIPALPSSSSSLAAEGKLFDKIESGTPEEGGVDRSFFTVNVEQRVREISKSEDTVQRSNVKNVTSKEEQSFSPDILQCVLHKQHVAHSTAMSLLAQTLRIHPHAISVAGMKDYIGDTVQRVRIEGVSPFSVLQANDTFRRKGVAMTLSHFSYSEKTLVPGDLFGNHFKIVLRGVQVEKSVIQEAVEGFQEFGFPNYYGCQRFSWFGGTEDAAFALLMHHPLIFAFRFLNYTDKSLTLRELLQRPRKYPHPIQDEYRRNVVRRLRRLSILPSDLDEEPFLSCPSFAHEFEGTGPQLSIRKKLIFRELWESYLDLELQSRRPTAQRLSSYLWNQALTLRLHHFGGQQVLEGDHCVPVHIRRLASSSEGRSVVNTQHKVIASKDNMEQLCIEDVVHPGFSFENIELPENAVGDLYRQICDRYHLQWSARHSSAGIRDFIEPPRPIVRRPIDLKHCFQPELEQLTLEFALERGCYANVAVSELMKLARCAGAERIQTVPAPNAFWDEMGAPDPGYVTSLQDIYTGYEDGLGFTSDTEEVSVSPSSEGRVWDHKGPFFLSKEEDPYVKAVRWGRQHLLRPMQRRELDEAMEKKRLFEKPLAKTITADEMKHYVGHMVPLGPNAHVNKVRRSLFKRRRRFPGAPQATPRFDRSIKSGRSGKGSSKALPDFYKLNRNAWNVTW